MELINISINVEHTRDGKVEGTYYKVRVNPYWLWTCIVTCQLTIGAILYLLTYLVTT